jgi:hypothetical protein
MTGGDGGERKLGMLPRIGRVIAKLAPSEPLEHAGRGFFFAIAGLSSRNLTSRAKNLRRGEGVEDVACCLKIVNYILFGNAVALVPQKPVST